MSADTIIHDADGLTIGYHNARACTVDGSDYFVGWIRQGGRFVDASGPEDGDTEDEVRSWCEMQAAIRG